jgi:hypothetical protein
VTCYVLGEQDSIPGRDKVYFLRHNYLKPVSEANRVPLQYVLGLRRPNRDSAYLYPSRAKVQNV